MRARWLLVYFSGFATGLVFLGALLSWQSPRLRTTQAAARPMHTIPPVTPSPAPRGSQPSLLIPVEGVTGSQLRDDFEETRGGHRHEAIDIPAPRGTPVLAPRKATWLSYSKASEAA